MSSARPHTGLPARPLWLGGILMSLASTLVSKRGGSVSAAMNQDRVGTTRDPRAPILISGHAAKSTKKRQPAMNRDPARRGDSLQTILSPAAAQTLAPAHVRTLRPA